MDTSTASRAMASVPAEKIVPLAPFKKYTQAVTRFCAWYEQEEQAPVTLSALTPIALIGYRNELQHEQHKSLPLINLHISALRVWCEWMTEQGYLIADPAAHVKLVGGEVSPSRAGL